MKIFCFLRSVLLLGLFLAVCGCASYSDSFAPIAADLARRDSGAALALLAKKKPPARDRLLFLMNRGMLLRMHGELDASNQEFAEAKRLAAELDALSLREQAAALTVNDGTRSYAGAPYERTLLNLYSALNYLELGELAAARVEALQVDLLLGELGDRGGDPLFTTDPFARYLSALIYEASGEQSDAMIAYRRAYEAYLLHGARYPAAPPKQLEHDLLRTSEALGLSAENLQYAAEFAIDTWQSERQLQEQGELVFTFHNGLAPILLEQSITVPVPPRGQLVRVALPTYLRRLQGFSAARLKIAGQQIDTEVFANIEELALAELERNQPAVLARATARAILKYQMSKKAGNKNDLGGLVANIAGVLSERADTRSWMSLPASIHLARIALPPGVYDLHVELLDPYGQPVKEFSYPGIHLEAGRKTVLSCHEVAVVSLSGEPR